MEEAVEKSAKLLGEARGVLAFTGAGLSTESGIPDFRSPGGIWDRYDPSDFDFHRIVSSDRAREAYWKMSTEFYGTMKDARPNPAHFALRELEETGRLSAIVTQNIDNLHQKAGSSPEKVIEIHGTAFRVSCLDCGRTYARDAIEARLAAGESLPACDDCSGILKPATISFGQAMPREAMEESLRLAEACDLCLVLGSSLVVYPAASVPARAHESGARLLIINRDTTPLDDLADVVIHDSVGELLPRIVRAAGRFS
ncbi:MAG: Sir2 family NAD-dependent protein deacetylase [Deltaproteobacteria bacterium]|nr:Sir2 family NAD-dependent protein deacetylase [Deltaproteobacteria bacterium]